MLAHCPTVPLWPALMKSSAPLLIAALALSACQSGGAGGSGAPGDSDDRHPYAGIAETETLRLTGTEPFWGGEIIGGTMTYTTPENPDGEAIRVTRFAGRNGVSFSGTLEEDTFVAAVSPGQCSDGMSDRIYPFNVTLRIGDDVRNGCAWSQEHPFLGPSAP